MRGRPTKRRAKARKPKLPAYPTPLPCVIVAVDQARTSGWATYVQGRPVCWGEVDAADAPRIEEILSAACELASRLKLPVVLIGEEHGRYGFRGGAKEGLGAAWGSWRFAAERLRGRGLPLVQSRVMRVNTKTWRAAFGLASLRSEHAKPYAIRAVKERLGIHLADDQHDIAEALLIGLWGTRAGAVGAKLPKRVMVAHGLYRETTWT